MAKAVSAFFKIAQLKDVSQQIGERALLDELKARYGAKAIGLASGKTFMQTKQRLNHVVRMRGVPDMHGLRYARAQWVYRVENGGRWCAYAGGDPSCSATCQARMCMPIGKNTKGTSARGR